MNLDRLVFDQVIDNRSKHVIGANFSEILVTINSFFCHGPRAVLRLAQAEAPTKFPLDLLAVQTKGLHSV